ncbi:hypothetical protein T484DRAFT_1753823 [Baffinella frigidus]|nr:hypothetical protein T484DRAFT_1753823 [Cryptophyta sp. CCMP2293]
MRCATALPAWESFINDAIGDMRTFRKSESTDDTSLSAKLWTDWRTFLERAGRVTQNKGYIKKRANAFCHNLVHEKGPASLVTLLLSEFKVGANIKDSRGASMFVVALQLGLFETAYALLVGSGSNKVTLATLDMDVPMQSPCITMATAMPAQRHFHQHDGQRRTSADGSNSTTFLVKTLLELGASLYKHPNARFGDDYWSKWCDSDRRGWNEIAHAVSNGDIETVQLLLTHAKTNNISIDMNRRYRSGPPDPRCTWRIDRQLTPLLLVTRYDAFDQTVCTEKCGFTHCNMPMIRLLIANGANPHIEPRGNQHLDLCLDARAQLGLEMHERVQRYRGLVILSLQKARQLHGETSFPDEVLALICKFAGIGEDYISDSNTPWMPTLPKRSHDPLCHWYGTYAAVDEKLAMTRANRRMTQSATLHTVCAV